MANVGKNGKYCDYPRELLNSRLYRIWQNMKTRCINKKIDSYYRYGGRGISYTPEWSTFKGFLETMPDGYADNLTLDRIDNNGNYEPSNCRWATPTEQANNTKRNRLVKFRGEEKTLAQWISHLGLKSSTVRQRYYVYKWPVEKCLTN